MARRKKLKTAGDTETRKVWNKKKTRKYTITTTLDERKEKKPKKAGAKKKATATRKGAKTAKGGGAGKASATDKNSCTPLSAN